MNLNNARSTMCTARIDLRRCFACAARRARGVRLFTLSRGLNNGLRLTVGQLTRDGHGPRGWSVGGWGVGRCRAFGGPISNTIVRLIAKTFLLWKGGHQPLTNST